MVLFGIVGELGSGKTLSLTYLAWKNWFFRRTKMYSTYHLYKIPYILIDSTQKLDYMRDGFVAGDEYWSICDARCSVSRRNKIVANMLLRSRKRNLNLTMTAQMIDLFDKRMRKILDFSCYPIMNPQETVCKIVIFRGGFPKTGSYMKTLYFKTPLVFDMYDTNEEVDFSDEMTPEIICFQESKESKPQMFETWEEADAVAEKYWTENYKSLKGVI